jgi:DNA-binding beta-propeller fold protein YncE
MPPQRPKGVGSFLLGIQRALSVVGTPANRRGSMGEQSGKRSASRRPFNRRARRQVVALALASSVLLVVTAGALAVTGDLTQPAGTAGCISETGAGNCADGHALKGPNGVAVSGDAKNVYATSYVGNAVARLNRNTTTGAITQPTGTAGCVSETGAGPCADGRALDAPGSVAVSSDAKSVYVASLNNGVARFNRDTTTGALSQPAGTAGCINEDGSGPCADGHGLANPLSVAVSSDGKSVYAVSSSFFGDNAVVRLNRNTTTGAISQPAGTAGCISEDGDGPCADGHGLARPMAVAISRDGKSVYVTSIGNHAVAILNRNTTNGAITQSAGTAGCISENGAGGCADGHALVFPTEVAVAPGGKSVYIASYTSKAVARFNRAP